MVQPRELLVLIYDMFSLCVYLKVRVRLTTNVNAGVLKLNNDSFFLNARKRLLTSSIFFFGEKKTVLFVSSLSPDCVNYIHDFCVRSFSYARARSPFLCFNQTMNAANPVRRGVRRNRQVHRWQRHGWWTENK